MNKKEKELLNELTKKVESLMKQNEYLNADIQEDKEIVKMREYLIRTNFIGELKNKEIIKKFKKHNFIEMHKIYNTVSAGCYGLLYNGVKTFEQCTNGILNFDGRTIRYFYTMLDLYEKEQKVLDKYTQTNAEEKGGDTNGNDRKAKS